MDCHEMQGDTIETNEAVSARKPKKRETRPFQSHRERYRKIFNRTMEKMQAEGEAFDLEKLFVDLPEVVTGNEVLCQKFFARVVQAKENMLLGIPPTAAIVSTTNA